MKLKLLKVVPTDDYAVDQDLLGDTIVLDAYEANDVNQRISELESDLDSIKKQRDDLFTQGIQVAFDLASSNLLNKHLSRMLWLARADRARSEACTYENIYLREDRGFTIKGRPPMHWSRIWQKVEKLCRSKADEFK